MPHLVPLDRGILETIYVRVPAGTTDGARSRDVYGRAYAGAPFVRLTGEHAAGDQARRAHELLRHRLELDAATAAWSSCRCIDNLLKGAAGQAVQNFNIVFGFDERTGLLA